MDILVLLTVGGIDVFGAWLTIKTGGFLFILATSMLCLYVAANLFVSATLTSALNGGASLASGDAQLIALALFILTIISLLLLMAASDKGAK